MIDTFLFFCLCSWSLAGVFGVDAVQSVSVTEGDSVSLNVTDIQTNDEIEWRFGGILIAEINRKNKKSTVYNDSADGRFKDRLKLDQTGSLIITNTSTNHSGLYKVSSSRRNTLLNTFNLTVYDKGLPIIYILSISAAAVIFLLIVVVVCCFCKIHRKTDQKVEAREEEITYADPTFYKRKAQKSKAQVEEDVVYAGVAHYNPNQPSAVVLEVHFTAEFTSNPDQTYLPETLQYS